MKLKLQTKLILCAILSIATVSVLGIFSHAVHADDNSDKKDYVLTISPARLNIGELQPGKTYHGTFNVLNDGHKAMDYEVYATGYKVEDRTYNPLYEDGEFTMISKWVTFNKTKNHIEPGAKDEITYTVKVPSDAPAGSQYAAIMVSTDSAAKDSDMIGNTGRLSLVIGSHVAGETVNCAKISETALSGFLLNPPISGSSVVENCGNIDAEAEYILKVFPLFSDEELYTNEENPDTKVVLPKTKRYNAVTWDQAPAFGIFRAEQIIRVGDQEDSIEKLVVICPLWLIILILIFIGAIVFWLISRNRERKEAKRRSSSAKHNNIKESNTDENQS